MKKISLLIITIATLVACKTEKPKDYMVFSGTITNFERDSIALRDIGQVSNKKIAINKDGTFSDTLKIESGYYRFYYGRKRVNLYLNKVQDLQLSYDVNDTINAITFIGDNVAANNYLLAKEKKIAELYAKDEVLYSLNENDFLSKIKSAESDLNELANNANLDSAFLKQELKNNYYDYVTYLNKYEGDHRYYAKDDEFKVSNTFPSEIENIELDNITDYKSSLAYRSFLKNHYRKLTQEKINGEQEKYYLAYMDLVNDNVTHETIKNDFLYNNSKFKIGYAKDLQVFYKKFMAYSTNDNQKEEITKIYNKLKATAKGELSPKFVNYENYKGGTTSLDDLKGKYVYVDVWASWCGPCIGEIPSLKKIEKQYHGKNIEFVSISVDAEKDHEIWKKMVAEKELGGIQLYADKDFKSDFISSYLISAIPRFILIDPDGKIVSPNAPRPSNSKLVELLTELGI